MLRSSPPRRPSVHNDGAGHTPVATALNSVLTRRNTATGETGKFTVVWFMEYNPPLGTSHTISMAVQHLHRHFNVTVTAEEQVDTSTTTTAPWLPTPANVTDYDSSGVAFGPCSSSDGTGAGTPRGWDNLRLTAGSPIAIQMTRSESALEERQSMSVVTMPSVLVISAGLGGGRLHGLSSGMDASEGVTGGTVRAQGF